MVLGLKPTPSKTRLQVDESRNISRETGDASVSKYSRRVVLQHRHTGHLNRELKDDSEHDLAQVGSVTEDLPPSALSGGFLPDLEAHLLELFLDKGVILVSSGVKSGERRQRLFFSANDHQPTRRFGQQEDHRGQWDRGKQLESQLGTHISADRDF